VSIRNKLIIAVVLALLLAAGGITATLVTRATVSDANKRSNLAREIVTQLLKLNVLRASYELYRSDQVRAQWENEQKKLVALLGQVSSLYPRNDSTIKHLQADNDNRRRLFEDLVASYQSEAQGKVSSQVATGVETRLIGSLLVLAQATIVDANVLSERSQSDLSHAQNLSTSLSIVFVVLLGLVVVLMAFLVGGTVLTSLGKLKAGADAVAAGYLETRIDLKRYDEMGAVAASFNRMSEELELHRDRLEDLVENRTRELKRANEELDAYAHAVSHDLKSPLAAATLANALLRDSAKDASDEELRVEVVESVEAMGHSLEIAHRMVTGLLKVAEAGQIPHLLTDVSISGIVVDVLGEHKATIEKAGTRLEIDEDLGTIKADHTQMYQVFSNVIGNCLRHNESPRPVLKVNYFGTEDDSHRYKVCDNGAGFPEGDIDKIFRPFFKGARTSDTGIGLSIVDKVIRAYGGWIKATNDGGACFEFAIPDWESDQD
jgi:signal transduction histidine kinase